MIYIDKYACFSALKEMNPLVKILFGGVSLMICLFATSLLSLAIVFVAMYYAVVWRAKIPWSYYTKLLLLPLGFLLLGVIGIVIDVTRSSSPIAPLGMLSFGDFTVFISKTGFRIATGLVCKSLAAVSCLYFIILTTPFRDIVHFLHLLRCPKILITLSVLTYQYIFMLMDIADTKLQSQRCRGGYRRFRSFARHVAMLWGSVFLQAWLKSRWTFQSMQSRGYEGQLKFMPIKFRITRTETAMLSLFFLTAIIPNFFGIR